LLQRAIRHERAVIRSSGRAAFVRPTGTISQFNAFEVSAPAQPCGRWSVNSWSRGRI